jgi:hypothetical protein
VETYQELKNILQSFEPITLKEMDSVELMDRFDFKMLFHIDKLPVILEKLKPFYKALEVKKTRLSKYDNRYFDTNDLRLFLKHHNKIGNRMKVRFRSYVDSNITFFEMKTKNNKGKTLKERISVNAIPDYLREEEKSILQSAMNKEMIESLVPTLDNTFYRLTLVNKKQTDRLTLDIGVNFKNNNGEYSLDYLVIAELKQEAHTLSSFMKVLFKEEKIYPISISKYAIGSVLLDPQLKYNNFKDKIIIINKLNHAFA